MASFAQFFRSRTAAGCRLGTSSTTRRPGKIQSQPYPDVSLPHSSIVASPLDWASVATQPPAIGPGVRPRFPRPLTVVGHMRRVQMIGRPHERKNPPATPAGGFAQVLLEPVAAL